MRQELGGAKWFDLLRTNTLLRLIKNPDLFRMEVEALPKSTWVVVDEVQKLPDLMNEVHALIAEKGRDYFFALSGSRARKLKRLDTNLLPGQP